MKRDLIDKIQEKMPEFSKGQKRIAEYILSHYDKAVFLTAGKLGDAVGVSESTVVRFAMGLGYEGYPKLQQDLAQRVQEKLQIVSRLDFKNTDTTQEELVDYVIGGDCARIMDLASSIDRQAFDMAVECILAAKHVYVIGLRSCSSLAQFFGFYLNMIREDVFLVSTNNSSEIFEQMLRVNEKDAVIGISFPRYSMRTLKALEFASSRKASIVTITDSEYSPLTMYSSCNLFAKSDMSDIADSLVAPMSLINALIMALCLKRKNKVIKNIEILEQVWQDYTFENSDELDMLGAQAKKSLNRLEKKL